jgi:hypothetical protein
MRQSLKIENSFRGEKTQENDVFFTSFRKIKNVTLWYGKDNF